MAVDTYTARGRLVLQGTGNNLNTWGQVANAQAIQPIDDMIAGVVALAVSGNVTLTANNGATDQARMSALQITGTGGTITVPGVQKHYRIDASAATGTITITTGSGVSAIVPAGLRADVFSPDGVNFYLTDSPTSRAYTDAAVLKANAGNLPGGSVNGQALFTRSGNAVWDYIAQTDVTGLSPRLAFSDQQLLDLQQNLARAQISIAKVAGTVVITTMGYSDGFQDQSGIDSTNSSGLSISTGVVSNLNQTSSQPPAAMTANAGSGVNAGYTAFGGAASNGTLPYYAFDQTSTEFTCAGNTNSYVGLMRPSGTPYPLSYTMKNSATSANVWTNWNIYGSNTAPTGVLNGTQINTGGTVASKNTAVNASSNYTMPSSAINYAYIWFVPTAPAGTCSIQEIVFLALGAPGPAVLRSKLFTTTALPKTATLTVFARTPTPSIVPNIDLVGKITRNGAASFTNAPLVQVGAQLADGSFQFEARNVDVTGQSAPNSLASSFGSEVDMTATREIDIIDVTLAGLP